MTAAISIDERPCPSDCRTAQLLRRIRGTLAPQMKGCGPSGLTATRMRRGLTIHSVCKTRRRRRHRSSRLRYCSALAPAGWLAVGARAMRRPIWPVAGLAPNARYLCQHSTGAGLSRPLLRRLRRRRPRLGGLFNLHVFWRPRKGAFCRGGEPRLRGD